MRTKFLTMMIFTILATCLLFPSVALAHGGNETWAEEWSDHGVVSTALVIGGVIVFGGGAFLALRRRR
ncbi:hypothetical protein BH23ACT11_BH23ACT11_13280 [soil metagenome]